MKKIINGIVVDMTQEEENNINEQNKIINYEYWNRPYKEIVNEKIREKYSLSDELALSRQREENPQEFKEYFDYCEQCKQYVKLHINNI